MVKVYQQWIGESAIKRGGEISMPTLGGGLKEPAISFETQRNPEGTGSLQLELYTTGARTYVYTPDETIQGLMAETAAAGAKPDSQKLEEIAALVRQAGLNLSQDLLQLFTQLESDIESTLKKHNIQ